MELMHDPQNCPDCGESVSPNQTGMPIPQAHGPYIAYVVTVHCPECNGSWLTQLRENT